MIPLAQAVLDSSIRISVVTVGVALVLMAARVRSGAARHAAWVAVLCAMLLMPVLPYCVPRVSIPLPLAADPASPNVEMAFPPAMPNVEATSQPAPVVAATVTAPESVQGSVWPAIAFGVYGFGLVVLLVRLLYGWISAQRLAGSARLIPALSGKVGVYESESVAVPLTIGLLAPRITLPATWREWSHPKLAAVLAHEHAHVERHDSLVSLIAHVNRCLFWFHPLAWWLERKLATTAEHACDDAGIQALGEPRRYAEILLDMADTVRRSGGRYAWQGVGMDGTGLLGQRIDRIVRGGFVDRMSPGRKAAVAVGCAASILVVAGCRQQAKPLADNPQTVQSKAESAARTALDKEVDGMTAQQADAVEDTLKSNPDDVETHKKLLIYYYRSLTSNYYRTKSTAGAEKNILARRRHILWFIEHRPADTDWFGLISPYPGDALADPEGYRQAKELLLAQVNAPDVTAGVLGNAAFFLRAGDRPLAEKLYLRARELDPKGRWASSLGQFYYETLIGSRALDPMRGDQGAHTEDAHSSYVEGVRQRLATSTDVPVLVSTGQMLMTRGRDLSARGAIDFNAVTLGGTYLNRATQLDPQAAPAHQGMLIMLREGFNRVSNSTTFLDTKWYRTLANQAQSAYMQGESADYYHHDAAAAAASWDLARAYAEQSLKLASKSSSDAEYGDAIFTSKMTLGLVAMRHGNRKAAVRYMLEASQAPRTEALAYSYQYPTFKLLGWLLKDGERDSVIQFLERFAQTNVSQKNYLLDSAALIRRGVKPLWYPE